METHIYIKYAIFITIVYIITAMLYGNPIEESPVFTETPKLPSLTWDGGFQWGNIGTIVWKNAYSIGRFITFDFTDLPWFLHIFLGLTNVIFMIFFILDFIHGFI